MRTPSVLIGKVFNARDAIAAGLLTRDNLRSRAWRRLFRGIYADASVRLTHEVRCAAALAFLVPPEATIAGRSAAALHGVTIGAADDPVELLVPPTSPRCRHAGIVVHRGRVDAADRSWQGRIPLTSPARTCWDLIRWQELDEAVAWIDRMVALGRVTLPGLAVWLERHRATAGRGGRRFARALSLVDARAESPQESRLRVRLALAGLPPPAVQHEIYDADGRLVARVALAWPEHKVAVEHDRLWPAGSAAQLHADLKRMSELATQGWTVLSVPPARLRHDFVGIAAELRSALGSARAMPPGAGRARGAPSRPVRTIPGAGVAQG